MKLILFNNDLRISDHPALFFAHQKSQKDNEPIIPIFIFDNVNLRPIGGASKWFLKCALKELQQNLELQIFKGDSLEILKEIFDKNKITEIYFNKLYEPDQIRLQTQIKNLAKTKNISVFDFSSYLLFEPSEIKNGSGNYFKVFTPFWKCCLRSWDLVREPLTLPTSSSQRKLGSTKELDVNDPSFRWDDDGEANDSWTKKLEKIWEFDREKILKNFHHFLKNNLKNYQEARDFPALEGTSKISPYLHFGLISVNETINLVKKHHEKNPQDRVHTAHFLREIGWREFCHHLLFHFPQLPNKNFKKEFDNFSWENNSEFLQKWQKGQTGYPIVDAGMRELWQTGFMHNRVRMIVASFLIKDLLIDWRLGEKWFWDCLTDANLANNTANWQWVAGSGADAAPYFRIFNPVLQGEKFDPNGEYVKKYLPELKNIPKKYIHQPWKLSDGELEKLGAKNYPKRIVLHEEARDMALKLYKNLK